MPCYSCTAEFGILKKEMGCDICGFSFCSRCCKRYEIVENETKCKKQLCSKCFNQIIGLKSSHSKGSPPLAHKKRMENFKKQSISIDSASHVNLKSQWSDKRDQELAERLQKLKRERIKEELPSVNEIAERIAKLKGIDPAHYNAPPIQVFIPTSKRTSIEQADDLMKQIKEEAEIESRIVRPEDEIALRLAALKGKSPELAKEDIDTCAYAHSSGEMDIEASHSEFDAESKNLAQIVTKEIKELKYDSTYKDHLSSVQEMKDAEESDDDMEADRLVEKLLSCNIGDDVEELDSIAELDSERSSEEKNKDSPTEEFPWCVICTEDAKLRCFGCDKDLYCPQCFKECHDSYELKSHKTCPYLTPAKLAV